MYKHFVHTAPLIILVTYFNFYRKSATTSVRGTMYTHFVHTVPFIIGTYFNFYKNSARNTD